MKSEEKLNEALRAALKRKFDDFEEQPNPASFNIIRAHIKQPRNYKYLFLSLLLVGIAVTGLVVSEYSTVNQRVGKAASEKAAVKISGHAWKVSGPDVRDSPSPEVSVAEAGRSLAVKVTEVSSKSSAAPRISIPETRSNVVRKAKVFKMSRNVSTDLGTNNFLEKTSTEQITTNLVRPDSMSEVGSELLQKVLANQPVSEMEVSQLEPEQIRPASMHLPGVAIPEKTELPNPIYHTSQKISWVVNVASLKTYQILTVPKSAGQEFQNFKFPSAFSLESLGYKFSVGLEKKGFQAMLHYSTFRQKYSYEIAGDEYIVQNPNQSGYTIVRPGTVVSENNKMDLLGLGLSKQVQWGHSFEKYYASAGIEYSHTLKSGTGIGWINASFGKQFAVGRTALLNVGPYAEFSPIKISGADNPFLYQPYRVGISVGMKLIRP